MFAICACTRFQVTPKASHLNAVKWIFRYLKHQPKLGLWYHRDSPFELEAFSDSDYRGASLDKKSNNSYNLTGRHDDICNSMYEGRNFMELFGFREPLETVLESCAKHNMVAYLEETDGNIDFHEIIGFLTRSSIHCALTTFSLKDLMSQDLTFWWKTSLKKKRVQKEYVSKQGRKSVKSSKGEPSVHKDPSFDDLDDDAIDYMETEDAQNKGRTSSVVLEEKESADKEVSTKAHVSTVKPNEGTAKRNEGTDKQDG
ncbi:hypothetical protein Tco_1444507, partial [Tanacetum coccineum]